MSETWRTVVEWPAYEVSDQGRVRRAKPGPGTRPGRVLVQTKKSEYRQVTLLRPDARSTRNVHTLVIEAFGPPQPTPEHQCNHINADKHDNRAENLEWLTSRENMQHAHDNGRMPRGVSNPQAKLTKPDVIEIRRRRANGETLESIAQDYPVTSGCISTITTRKRWTHVD